MPIPRFDIEFTKDGAIFDETQVTALIAGIGPITDLLVVSHGWNNDKADAAALYDELLGNVDRLLELRGRTNAPPNLKEFLQRLDGRQFAAVRVFWPSKKFTDSELIPGGGSASVEAAEANQAAVKLVLDRLKESPELLGGNERNPAHDQAMEEAKTLIPQLDTIEAKKRFVDLLRGILDDSMKEKDDASEGFFSVPAETLFANAEAAVAMPIGATTGGGTSVDGGGAAGLGDLVSGAVAGARRIANFATYYQMKARAGAVGSKGLADVLRRVRQAKPDIRIHLVGHSFGGRVVTAVANSFAKNTEGVTMSLLQAAFSHNALSADFDGKSTPGFFRAVVAEKRISGPIIITHTKNDKAVGVAYPLASRIAGQNAAALGDKDDPYGGMGRNGAQKTTEADDAHTLGLPGTRYSFRPGRVHNIQSDLIRDHSDIKRIEVAYAVLSNAGSV